MTKPKWLDRRVALSGPYMTLCLSEDAARKAYKDLGLPLLGEWAPPGAARTHHLVKANGPPACVVAIDGWQGRDPCAVAALLVHEAVHVWQAHCDDIGEDAPGREQEAYAIQCIAATLMEDFARQMKEMTK